MFLCIHWYLLNRLHISSQYLTPDHILIDVEPQTTLQLVDPIVDRSINASRQDKQDPQDIR